MKLLGGGGSNERPVSRSTASTVDTLIGKQTEIQGDVTFSGGLHVDGTIRGSVQGSPNQAAALSVSESGAIHGNVIVPNVILNGSIWGDVHTSERIVLGAKARVNGDVYYRVLEIQAGAQINGKLVHETDTPSGALTHQPQMASAPRVEADEVIEVRDLRRAGRATT